MPEMFDDAEGFYGLEEVEGVEIVRDGQNVKFVGIPIINLMIEYLLLLGNFYRSTDR